MSSIYSSIANSKVLILVVLIISIIVTYTATFSGVIGYIFGSFDNLSQLEIIAYGVVLFFIQAYLLIASTHNLINFKKISLGAKIIWLILFLVIFFISALFSYTFYYGLFSADSYSKRVLNNQVQMIVNNASNYEESFSSIRDSMINLASYSEKKALEEKSKGGTCGGFPSKGDGPRTRYRLQEEKVFNEQALAINRVYQKVQQYIQQVRKLKSDFQQNKIISIKTLQSDFNVVISKINFLVHGNTDLKNTLNILDAHYGNNRDTGGKEKDGEKIYCPDGKIDQEIKLIKNKVSALPLIENTALFDKNDLQELQNRVIQVVQSLIFKTHKTDENLFGLNDYLALGLGFFFEILVLIMSIILHEKTKHEIKTNKYGYKGDYISSYDIQKIVQNTSIDINQIKNFQNMTFALNNNYIFIKKPEEESLPLNILEKHNLFSTVYHAMRYEDFYDDLQDYFDYEDDDIISIYISPKERWSDFKTSLDYYKTS